MTTRTTNRKAALVAATTAVTLALAACATGPTPQQKSNMSVYGDFKNAWNHHDAKAIAAAFATGSTYTSPATGGSLTDPAITGFTHGLFTAIPDFQVEVMSATPVDESQIAEQWVVKGTWTQPFPDGPLAGAPPQSPWAAGS